MRTRIVAILLAAFALPVFLSGCGKTPMHYDGKDHECYTLRGEPVLCFAED